MSADSTAQTPGANGHVPGSKIALPVQHLGLVLSAAALVVTALKVGAVAHGDMQVAAGILSIRGWASVPSLLLTAVPYIVVVAVGLALLDLNERYRDRQEFGGTPRALVILIPLAAAIGPRSMVLVGLFTAIVVGVVSMAIRKARRPSAPKQSSRGQSITTVLAITGLGGLVYASASPAPWLPREQIERAKGVTITGYVLGDQGALTAVLIERSRQIEWIPTESIQARFVCPQPIEDRPLLPSLIWRSATPSAVCAK